MDLSLWLMDSSPIATAPSPPPFSVHCRPPWRFCWHWHMVSWLHDWNIIKESSAKDASKLCVNMFLPMSIITNVGPQVDQDTVKKYPPIMGEFICYLIEYQQKLSLIRCCETIVWSIVYILLSLGCGTIFCQVLQLSLIDLICAFIQQHYIFSGNSTLTILKTCHHLANLVCALAFACASSLLW